MMVVGNYMKCCQNDRVGRNGDSLWPGDEASLILVAVQPAKDDETCWSHEHPKSDNSRQ